MRVYILKRILSMIPVLLVVAVIVFLLMHITPGNPAAVILGPDASAEEVRQLEESLGLNLPVYEQFIVWFSGLFQGNLGWSIHMNKPVLDAFISHLGPTLSLAILAQLFAVIFAIPLGILAATKRGTYIDRMVMGMALFGVSVPNFILALILVIIFSVNLSLLPVAGYRSLDEGIIEHLRYMVLPAISLGAIQMALIARVTRTSMLDVLSSNYVKTALSKGLRDRVIIYKHALKNAIIPILTVIGQTFGQLVAGAVVIETVFNIPGIGQLIVNSLVRRDFEVIQGSILLIALTYLFINLIVDLLYGLFDPRIRFGKSK